MCLASGEEVAKQLEQRECQELAPYALRSSERRAANTNFREYKTAGLEYRTEYHRDRDRIIWSKTFKRLQHKTQIFPYYVEDHYRRRLTHSLEVAQIAATIARALKLNEVATEAIGLGHDLGHTPFGHAGEDALNKILLEKGGDRNRQSDNTKIPIFGFNHCVHGIEVVTRIEQEYKSESNTPGLNLTLDIQEGILKHMYNRDVVDPEKPFSSISEVVKFEPYKRFGDNKGSLEAQCVYFSDALAYLLSDIEDGLRCNVLRCDEIEKDEFIKNIWEQYNGLRKRSEHLKLKDINDFLLFRRRALTVLILDCVKTSQKQIQEENIKNIDEVYTKNKRMIAVETSIESLWDKFYKKWIINNFFNDRRVVSCTHKAGHIINQLFNAYLGELRLIPDYYRRATKEAYAPFINNNEQELLNLVTVRNYIAGMTDVFATNQHARLFMPLEHVPI